MTIDTALNILKSVKDCVDFAGGSNAVPIQEKFRYVLENNPGFEKMCRVRDALQSADSSGDIADLTITDVAAMKYAPLVSVDVERSFSRHKSLLSDRRLSLTAENVKLHLIPMCYRFLSE